MHNACRLMQAKLGHSCVRFWLNWLIVHFQWTKYEQKNPLHVFSQLCMYLRRSTVYLMMNKTKKMTVPKLEKFVFSISEKYAVYQI